MGHEKISHEDFSSRKSVILLQIWVKKHNASVKSPEERNLEKERIETERRFLQSSIPDNNYIQSTPESR
jgi:hypothetical protein